MNIQSLTYEGFKGANEPRSYQFGLTNRISGENYQGKTSIAEAIIWGLYGLDLFGGSKSFDRLLNQDSKKAIVEIVYEVSGKKYTLQRTRKGSSTSISLNGKVSKQGDIEKHLPDKDVFLSIFTQNFFPNLPNPEARSLLMRILPEIEPVSILSELSKPQQELIADLNLLNVDNTMKELRQEIKENQQEITRTLGQMDILKKSAYADIGTKQVFNKDEQIEQIQAMIKDVSLDTEKIKEISRLELELQNLGKEYRKLELQKKELLEKVYDPGLTCELCGQEIRTDHLEQVKANDEEIALLLQKDMNNLIEQGKTLKAEIE